MRSKQRRLVFAFLRLQVEYLKVGRQASLPDPDRVVLDINQTVRQAAFSQAAVNKMHGALSVYVTRLTGDPFTGTTLLRLGLSELPLRQQPPVWEPAPLCGSPPCGRQLNWRGRAVKAT